MQKSAAPLTAAILAKKGFASPAISAAGATRASFRLPGAERHQRPLKLCAPGGGAPSGGAPSGGTSGSEPLPNDRGAGHGTPRRSKRVTLRMDPDHYLRARIAAAHLGMSVQRLMLAAIDTYLNEVGSVACDAGCACLAQEAAAPAPATGTEQDR